MLDENQVKKYLEIIKDIKKSHTLIDMHMHPFNLISNDLQYNQNPECEGLFSAKSTSYAAPGIQQLRTSHPQDRVSQDTNPDLRAKMALLTSRRLYNHTGPKVFSDHMRLSGIDKALLLPVKSAIESDDSQIQLLDKMFGNDERFALGYCVSNNIPSQTITNVVKDAVKKYSVKAIKIHPNITGIDLSSSSGRQKIEHILEASDVTNLNVVIHGGRSTHLNDTNEAAHSIIQNLKEIDWGITKQAVVIAHAGTYGHDITQTTEEILPLLNNLLDKYNNLFVDISGLTFDKIRAIVGSVDHERVLFGSDALYNSQWGAIVKLLHALRQSGPDYEEQFLKITSVTPSRLI